MKAPLFCSTAQFFCIVYITFVKNPKMKRKDEKYNKSKEKFY